LPAAGSTYAPGAWRPPHPTETARHRPFAGPRRCCSAAGRTRSSPAPGACGTRTPRAAGGADQEVQPHPQVRCVAHADRDPRPAIRSPGQHLPALRRGLSVIDRGGVPPQGGYAAVVNGHKLRTMGERYLWRDQGGDLRKLLVPLQHVSYQSPTVFSNRGLGHGWDHRSQPSSRLSHSTPASALPCPAGRSVPGRGGPERRRRPRPYGTGTPDAHEIAHGTRHDTPRRASTGRDTASASGQLDGLVEVRRGPDSTPRGQFRFRYATAASPPDSCPRGGDH
jgi:hypothetical protein